MYKLEYVDVHVHSKVFTSSGKNPINGGHYKEVDFKVMEELNLKLMRN